MISIQGLLTQGPVEASAPCRVDSGGTWDIKALSLPLEAIEPTTVNLALTLRTSATLHPYREDRIKIVSQGFPRPEVSPAHRIPFDSPFGILFAAVSYFGFCGLEVRIVSQAPVRSALGGSSTALVALIKALSKTAVMRGDKGLSKRQILHLAYHIEDGISGGNCGIQDQAAAVFGGAHQWKWRYGIQTLPFERIPLLDRKGERKLSRRLLVAFSGKSHTSSRVNRQWIHAFLSGKTRDGWIEVNQIVHRFAQAIKLRDWELGAALLKKEMSLRKEITPEALNPLALKLVEQAESAGCGARFTGAGAGGSLWALGEIEKINKLRIIWGTTLAPAKGARILACRIDSVGVK